MALSVMVVGALSWESGRAATILEGFPAGMAARVAAVRGKAEWSASPGGTWRPVRAGLWLPEGAVVRTAADALVELDLGPGRSARIDAASQVAVGWLSGSAGPRSDFRVFLGRIWVNLRRELSAGEGFTVVTPAAVIGVRGTAFTVFVASDGATLVAVHHGEVVVEAVRGTVKVRAGQELRVVPGGAVGEPQPQSTSEQAAGQRQGAWLKQQTETGPSGGGKANPGPEKGGPPSSGGQPSDVKGGQPS